VKILEIFHVVPLYRIGKMLKPISLQNGMNGEVSAMLKDPNE
jgi:hypothetical protein